ncbi:damage-control phosphatase ARMT1-like isoform X2 [Stegodyphus dumicola]|nr:damage-control phosphatase ARMT1-like isoform X2 [Stegodyphus dumicola]XP_035215318.1 damage-control phosphatase ARMT1-like isoform X2 [Stegodyphus dumicola]
MCQDEHSIEMTYGEVAKEEVKGSIGKLYALENEMVTNKPVLPLVDDLPDVKFWNDYSEKQKVLYGFPPAWYASSWLYVECYFYRRIKEAFQLSSALREYDPFQKQKNESFLSEMDSVVHLLSALNVTLLKFQNRDSKEDTYNSFRIFLQVALWGNKWDLCMANSEENVHDNPLLHLEEMKEKIIVDDTEVVWQILQDANNTSKEVQIDIVLDNAGFELFVDLCFMYFLQATNLVKKIRFHVKCIPWFVSDTHQNDLQWLLKTLSESDHEILIKYSKEWSEKFSSGEWTIEKEIFWTLPHDYSEMKATDANLYNKLSQSHILIFKGDLNYRKLTGDRQWMETTPFMKALNGFSPTSIVSLRTVKSNVIVGLKAEISENLSKISTNWKFSGDFAVIQCARN